MKTPFIIGSLLLIFILILVSCDSDNVAVSDDASEVRNTQLTVEPTLSLSLGDDQTIETTAQPGELNYNLYCAHCHGYDGEGQLATTVENTRSLGMKTVPPHNADGHTWEHASPLLVDAILNGIDNPLNHYVMSGFSHALNEQDALDIIDYIRQWWTEDQREYQQEVTRNYVDVNGD